MRSATQTASVSPPRRACSVITPRAGTGRPAVLRSRPTPGIATTRTTRGPMNLTDAPEYLTVPQLAEVLQVPVATIYRWRHLGEGPRGIRVSGRHVRFRRSDVEAWLQEREDPAVRRTSGRVA